MALRLRKKQDATEYIVKVEHLDAGEYSLVFDSRDAARRYKRALKESNRKLVAHIYKIESENGYMYPEKEVW